MMVLPTGDVGDEFPLGFSPQRTLAAPHLRAHLHWKFDGARIFCAFKNPWAYNASVFSVTNAQLTLEREDNDL